MHKSQKRKKNTLSSTDDDLNFIELPHLNVRMYAHTHTIIRRHKFEQLMFD